MPPATCILCPLAFEARALKSLEQVGLARIVCTGPGPERIGAAVERAREETLILAGLATALQADVPAGSAVWVERVQTIDARPTIGDPDEARRVVACQVRDVLPDRPCREAVQRATGADVADMECATFAAAAAQRGVDWAIVRGISDALDATLPPVWDWIDDAGRTRGAAAGCWLALHPLRLGRLLALRRDSADAMKAVRELLERLLGAC